MVNDHPMVSMILGNWVDMAISEKSSVFRKDVQILVKGAARRLDSVKWKLYATNYHKYWCMIATKSMVPWMVDVGTMESCEIAVLSG